MIARDALIAATRTLLATKGYEATSPADIQRASGVGQGSFYHHFESKADLASVALSELAADMCAEFDRLTVGEPLDAVTAYLGLERDPLSGCHIGRICMESSLADNRIREPIGRYFEHLRAQLTDTFDQLDLPIAPAALADLAIAAVQGAYVTARATGDRSTMAGATTALLQLITTATRMKDWE